MADVARRDESIESDDGVTLAGTSFAPAEGPVRRAVLIAPATGVRQHLYFAMAEELARRGSASLVFDYRGMGASWGSAPLRQCTARKRDWGERDLPAALDHLAARSPGVPLVLLGHSAGGQLAGLMPNVGELERIVQVSGSSGYVGGIPGAPGLVARLLLAVVIPATCATVGYAPGRALGWGEDLPRGVALDWARWCSTPGYVGSDLGTAIPDHHYDEIRCPLINVRFADDPIASEANVSDLLTLFPNARITRVTVDPREHGLDAIGHIDVFRKRCRAAWDRVIGPVVGAVEDPAGAGEAR